MRREKRIDRGNDAADSAGKCPVGSRFGGSAARYAAAALGAIVADVGSFKAFVAGGMGLMFSEAASLLVAVVCGGLLWAATGLAGEDWRRKANWKGLLWGAVVFAMAVFLRAGILSWLVQVRRWAPLLGILPATAASAAVGGATAMHWSRARAAGRTPGADWGAAALGVIGYSILLRLAFAGAVNLIPEEAYYWLYGMHLDISYPDHPPMVGWLIRLSTTVLGNNEIGVRAPALVCWIAAAGFLFAFTRNLFGTRPAVAGVGLFAALPIYFGAGLVMTPEAPLYAAWAGSLYFIERAVMAGRRPAWLAAGVCIGLGMLSKYTIALLGAAAVLFMILDKRSRKQLVRPEVYAAGLIALVIFLPVVVWNAMNGWKSFVLQGPQRWTGTPRLYVHVLLSYVMAILTPVGFLSAVWALLPRRLGGMRLGQSLDQDGRKRLFMVVLALFPFSIFFINSLTHEPKLNWTGPLWLALMPLMAVQASGTGVQTSDARRNVIAAAWKVTMVVCLLVSGAALSWAAAGLPGLAPERRISAHVGWREIGESVEALERQVAEETGKAPIVIGMDDHFTSSEVAFYDPDGDGVGETSGRHLLDRKSLAWAIWAPKSEAIGKDVIMVSLKSKYLAAEDLDRYFGKLGEMTPVDVEKDGRPVARFFYRVGYSYRP